MTAKELITELSKLNPDTELVCKGRGEYSPLQSLEKPDRYDKEELRNLDYSTKEIKNILLLNWEY